MANLFTVPAVTAVGRLWDDPEGIIVLFCLLACIGLPVVERDFHSRQQQAAAEAANPRGQVVQMA
jgi:hypothetical protein